MSSRWFSTLLLVSCATAAPAPDAPSDEASRLRAEIAHADDVKRTILRDELARIELARARDAHTMLAYRRFLAEFPAGEEATTARGLLEGLAFDAARKTDTRAAWEAFIDEFPRGRQLAEARARLGALFIAEAMQSTDLKLVRRTLARFPDHPDRERLLRHEDDLAFSAANDAGADALTLYLAEHPSGAHRAEAEAKREGLALGELLASGDLPRARQLARIAGASAATRRTAAELAYREAARRFDAAALASLAADADPAVTDVASRARALQTSLAEAPVADALRSRLSAALPSSGLPAVPVLLDQLREAEPLERVEALELLAEQADPALLGPLLDAAESRFLGVRLAAIEAVATLRSGLAPSRWSALLHAREAESASRTISPTLWRRLAILREADGRADDALAAWQEALRSDAEDPVARLRTLDLLRMKGERLAAQAAARDLAKSLIGFADRRIPGATDGDASAEPGEGRSVGPSRHTIAARQFCSALGLARHAVAALSESRAAPLSAEAAELVGLAVTDTTSISTRLEARLTEAEAAARREEPSYRPCAPRRSEAVLAAAREGRRAALDALVLASDPRLGPALEPLVNSPAPVVAEAAQRALKAAREAPLPVSTPSHGTSAPVAPRKGPSRTRR